MAFIKIKDGVVVNTDNITSFCSQYVEGTKGTRIHFIGSVGNGGVWTELTVDQLLEAIKS